MIPEFQIQAVKLQAQQRQARPVKYVPPKAISPQMPKRSSSQQRSTKVKTSATRKSSDDNNNPQLLQDEPIVETPPAQQKQFLNMDERYLYYQNEAKKRDHLMEVCDGVMYYKPVKPEDLPKPPKALTKKKVPDKPSSDKKSTTTKQEYQSCASQQEKSHYEKSIGSFANADLDEIPSDEHKPKVSPDFLIEGEVDGYQLDQSQSQIFQYGLSDYVSEKSHKKDIGMKDVEEEVKPKSEPVFTYYDYYPANLQQGEIPKPLLQSVNYMNWLKQQQELLQQQQSQPQVQPTQNHNQQQQRR